MGYLKLVVCGSVLLAALAGCGGGGGGGAAGNGNGGNGGNGGPPDTTAPTVSHMSPGEDVSGVGTNGRLTVTFSEAMTPAAINAANFRLTNGVDSVPGTVTLDAANHIAVFEPTSGLAPDTRYTATMVTGIKDLAGNPLASDFAWCFVTGPGADASAPGVASTVPAGAASGVAVNRSVVATFSADMDSASITSANFTLTGPGAVAVAGTVSYGRRAAVFVPSGALAANATYTASIGTGVKGLTGVPLPARVSWSFVTGAAGDATAPVVAAVSPAPAASGVAIGQSVSVTFSEPMNPMSITTANLSVTTPGAAGAAARRVIGTVSFDVATNTATFVRINHLTTPVAFHLTPVSDLEPNTTYTATLGTGAKDLAGNALVDGKVWSFTTAP